MRKTRSIIALLLILVMALSVACSKAETETSNSEPEKAGATTGEKETATETETETEPDIGPLTKYDEPITVTSVRIVPENWTFKEGEDISNNVWTEAYKNDLNVNLEYLWISSNPDQHKQKMNVMVASGELPDTFQVDATLYNQLADAGKLAPMDGMLEKYGTPELKEYYEKWGSELLEETKASDGVSYGLPWNRGGSANSSIPWIRQDWLDELGLEAPKTIDELIELAYTFKEADLSGTGTYGLALNKDLFKGGVGTIAGFFDAYGSYVNIWHKDDSGNIVYGSTTPQTKTALASLAKLYADGLIDPEFGAKDHLKVRETTTQDKVGISFGPHYLGGHLAFNVMENPNAEWRAYENVFADGVDNKVATSKQVSEYFVVSAEAEHPEIMIKILNLDHEKIFVSDDPADAEIYGWSQDEYQDPFAFVLYRTEPYGKNEISQELCTEAYLTGDTSKLNGEQLVYYNNLVKFADNDDRSSGTPFAHYSIFGPYGSQKILRERTETDGYVWDELTGMPVESWLEYGSTLEDLRLEVFTKIITGEESIDAFDKFVEDWYALGGEDATKEMNEKYN